MFQIKKDDCSIFVETRLQLFDNHYGRGCIMKILSQQGIGVVNRTFCRQWPLFCLFPCNNC